MRAFQLAELSHGGLYLDGELVAELLATGMTAGMTFEVVEPSRQAGT